MRRTKKQQCTYCDSEHDTICDKCGRPVCYGCMAEDECLECSE